MEGQMNDNSISRAYQTYKKYVPSPAVEATGLGLLTFLAARYGWDQIAETARSIGRVPGKAMMGLPNDAQGDAEWDIAIDELKNDPKMRTYLPIAMSLGVAGADLGFHYDPAKENGGLMSYKASPRLYKDPYNKRLPLSLVKDAALHKAAESDDWQYSGYIPEMDFSQTINARQASSMFTNDPFLQNEPYVRNMGAAIINNAANMSGVGNPTLGNVFDSAVDKIGNKLSFEGIASVGARTVLANGLSRLLTNAVGAVMDLAPSTRQNLVDAGTWAGAVSAILR